METRRPIVASQFYPGRHDQCVAEIGQCLEEKSFSGNLPETIVAGIVPHAGWAFSGDLAAMVFDAIKRVHEDVGTFVIFGAAHGYFGLKPAVYNSGSWTTPLGDVAVDEELASAVLAGGAAVGDTSAHRSEHSIEVQVPFIQHLFPGAKIVPIIVAPNEQALELGSAVAEAITADKQKRIICIGSTDLTHYGPRYGFAPMGTGAEAFQWASSVNDQQFIELALKLEARELLSNAAENCNACGAGAAAAAIAAAKKLGKTEGVLLAHTNSNEIMFKKMGASSTDSVGYAAIVF